MELKLLTNADKTRLRADILSMLTAADNDFVPPLSARFSPLQTTFGETPLSATVSAYFEDMCREQMLAVLVEVLDHSLDRWTLEGEDNLWCRLHIVAGKDSALLDLGRTEYLQDIAV